jgi:hypothetical protein
VSRLVVVAVLVSVLTGCSLGDASETTGSSPSQPRSASEGVDQPGPPQQRGAQLPRRTQECQRPRTFLALGSRQVPISTSPDARTPVTVHLGQAIRLRATGICADTVSAQPQGDHLRVVGDEGNRRGWPWRFEAASPGVVRLVLTMPTCAQPRGVNPNQCIGGIHTLGTAVVNVRP